MIRVKEWFVGEISPVTGDACRLVLISDHGQSMAMSGQQVVDLVDHLRRSELLTDLFPKADA